MSFYKIILGCTLMVFTLAITNIPTAEAGKKSDESEKSQKSARSDKSDKSMKSQKTKVDICHVSKGNGKIKLISVSERSANKHLSKHGDALGGTYFEDTDGDGFGDAGVINSCPVAGYVASGGDCSVNDASVFPGAEEVCGDGIDNNCDGEVDELCAAPQTFVDIVGDCDGFGSEQPYSNNPAYFQVAEEEGTDQDGQQSLAIPGGQPTGWCVKETSFEWTHNLDELPGDATITGLVLQVNSYGIDDGTTFGPGESRDNRLYVDGVEVPGAYDGISSSATARVDYFNLPAFTAADGTVNVAIDPSGGELPDCVFFDYSELVVEYTSGTEVDSPPAGFCQNGDQPSQPSVSIACPCGSANEPDILNYFMEVELEELVFRTSEMVDLVELTHDSSNSRFTTNNRTGCELRIENLVRVSVNPLLPSERTACQAEIRRLADILGVPR